MLKNIVLRSINESLSDHLACAAVGLRDAIRMSTNRAKKI